MPFRPSGDTGGTFSPSSGGGGAAAGGGGSTAPAVPGVNISGGYGGGTYTVTRKTADRVEYGPGVPVGPRDVVRVRPIRSNAGNVQVSTESADAAKFGPFIALAASDNPLEVTVRNLNEIGVYTANVGEGAVIDHQRRP